MKGLGIGIRVGGFAVPFPHCRFYLTIKPLLTADPGRPDTGGHWMHLKYSGNITQATRSSLDSTAPDYAEPRILVEFDADGVITLPYCGDVEVIGGLGDYLVNVAVGEHASSGNIIAQYQTAPPGYQPMLHTLRRFIREGSFTVPDWHTRIWGYNPTDTFLEVATGAVLAPGIEPGTRTLPGTIYTPINPANAVTAWIG